jgi:DNA-binding CsgD family transcriptional regulator
MTDKMRPSAFAFSNQEGRTNQQSNRLPWHIDAPLLGLGAALAGFLELTANDSSLISLLSQTRASLFVESCLVGILLLGILTLIYWLFSGSKNRGGHQLPVILQRWMTGAAIAAIATSMILTYLAVDVFTTSSLLPLVAGLLFGTGCLLTVNLWGILYAALQPESALLHASLSMIISTLLAALGFLPILNTHPLWSTLVLFAISAVTLWMGVSRPGQPETSSETETQETRPLLVTLGRALWKPLVGGMLSAFIIGLVWDPVASRLGATTAESAAQYLALAPLTVAVLTLIALVWRPREFSLHVFNDIVMPIVVLLTMPLPLIASMLFESNAIRFFTEMFFAVVVLAAWASMAQGARTAGLAGWVVFSAGCALFAAAELTGMVAIHFIGLGGQLLCLALLTLFLVSVIVDFALQGRPQSRSRELQRDVFERFLRQRCDSLSAEYGLSNREQEVFLYLARGYSHVFIAKELYVSENTIRTHVKHIYTKLGLTSREELIRLIDAEESPSVKSPI